MKNTAYFRGFIIGDRNTEALDQGMPVLSVEA